MASFFNKPFLESINCLDEEELLDGHDNWEDDDETELQEEE